MEKERPEYAKDTRPNRKRALQIGAIVVGAILATGITYEAVKPRSDFERSSEFSATPDWEQNFIDTDRSTLDTNIWSYENSPDVPGYNDEAQGYTDWRENVRIEPGIGLVIEAHKRDYRYPNDPANKTFEYTSGRINTVNSLSFEYGKIEARMKLPEGEGVWPAFWLLSGNEVHTLDKDFTEKEKQEQKYYLRNGEIDIMEYYGNNPNVIEGTVHTYNDSSSKGIPVADVTHTYHTYGVEITPDAVYWTFDDKPYHRFLRTSNDPKEWPFGNNNEMYVILNLAMGGPAGEINDAQEPWRLEVADIAYYDYTGDN